MRDFRRRPADLKPETVAALDAVFEWISPLGVICHLRWRATAIFDTPQDVVLEKATFESSIAEARESGLYRQQSISMLEGHWNGIPA